MQFVRLLIRLALFAVAAVVGLAMMAFALAVMLVLALASLLTGRKPVINVSGFMRARQHMARGGRPTPPPSSAEVVDVEAREVADNPAAPHQRLEDNSPRISP